MTDEVKLNGEEQEMLEACVLMFREVEEYDYEFSKTVFIAYPSTGWFMMTRADLDEFNREPEVRRKFIVKFFEESGTRITAPSEYTAKIVIRVPEDSARKNLAGALAEFRREKIEKAVAAERARAKAAEKRAEANAARAKKKAEEDAKKHEEDMAKLVNLAKRLGVGINIDGGAK